MRSFDDTLMETINEVIRNVFEEDTAEIIFHYLEGSDPKKMEERVQIFTDALPKILGVGSIIIEDLILETLYLKYGLELERKKNHGFTDYIKELKEQLQGSKATKKPREGESTKGKKEGNVYETQPNIVG